MGYQYVNLTCVSCDRMFDFHKLGFDAYGGMVMVGTCPHCSTPNVTETTIAEAVKSVQDYEIQEAEIPDLSKVIVTIRPQ